MNKTYKLTFYLIGILTFILAVGAFLKFGHFSWIDTNTSYAKVTINFLFPMDQATFEEHLLIADAKENQTQFNYSINWLNDHTAEITLTEQNELKGQKVKLIISNAPTKYKGFYKTVNIPVQFKADIKLIEPTTELLISSTNSFLIAFNTPITLTQLNKYIQSNIPFSIQSYDTTDETVSYPKDTCFVLTPEAPLENGQTYTLFIKAGMHSKAGTFLKENQVIQLKVDEKPSIKKTYPNDGDKWIGLYPHISVESKEEVIKITATLNGTPLKGKLIDATHAYFILDQLLKPETEYELVFQAQVESGETSDIKKVHFTTTTIDKNRFWLDIRLNKKQIKCYEGTKCIKVLPFKKGFKNNAQLFGTYYLKGKLEVYEDTTSHLGGNYWMMITDQIGIQGDLRNASWQTSTDIKHSSNLILTDANAKWLYEMITSDTMIIIRN